MYVRIYIYYIIAIDVRILYCICLHIHDHTHSYVIALTTQHTSTMVPYIVTYISLFLYSITINYYI